MGAILYIPEEDGSLGRVEITTDLEIIFRDHDIRYDQTMAALGGGKSYYNQIEEFWEEHPMEFLCESGLVPIVNLGIVSSRVAMAALDQVSLNIGDKFKCLSQARRLVKICERQWTKQRRDVSMLYNARQELVGCWNRHVRHGWKKSRDVFCDDPLYAENVMTTVATECMDFISDFWLTTGTSKGHEQTPRYPCSIAELSRKAIASTIFKHAYLGFREALSHINAYPDLQALLDQIEKDQARVAVAALEKLS